MSSGVVQQLSIRLSVSKSLHKQLPDIDCNYWTPEAEILHEGSSCDPYMACPELGQGDL